ncbi:hypothetical protein LPTSP2_38420 [Leptospira ellinghausenii]|uniref:Uncharacterized protein n=1 Tax=Leptospira ellinghausenii TaxID=1917822 RepID=A0A2P2DIV7_9LEPT|nr:hypothetical protein [Leptospira ellinghausenii]GBF44539.1 hypothetical protein LPTSP2_38420 [Leptospira ellinghausenii]
MNNKQAYAFLISLVFIFLNCATNIEKLKASNDKLLDVVGIPIYILSTKEIKKYYHFVLNPDGKFQTDIPSLSHCNHWDVDDQLETIYLVCKNGNYNFDLKKYINYDSKIKKVNVPYTIRPYVSLVDFKLNYVNLNNPWFDVAPIVKFLDKDGLSLFQTIYFIIGDENLNKFKEAIVIRDTQMEEDSQRLVRGIPLEQIIDLRYDEKLNFILAHQNEIENPDLFFTLTHQYLEMKLSDYEKLIKENANLKSKKYLVFETDLKKTPYDIKNRGFTLNIYDEYTGGFKRFFSPPIFVSMEIEKYEEMKYDKVVCIAEYEVYTQSETAYLSTKYNGILNKDNFEKYKANFREGLPYIKEQVIKYKQIRLKVLNYRIFNWEEETGDSYWKQ